MRTSSESLTRTNTHPIWKDLGDHIFSSLSGLVIGDLLGGLCERNGACDLPKVAGDALAELSEGGLVTSAAHGQVSDDTILMLATLHSIGRMGFVCRTELEARFRRIDTRGGHQIHKLRASSPRCFVATTGATNGAVLRAAAIGYLYEPDMMGDLLHDVLKIGSLTHGHPNALVASMLVGAAVALAIDGQEKSTIGQHLVDLATPITRLCHGGELIFDNLSYALHAVSGRDHASAIDALEQGIGLSVSAASSVVTGLTIALAYPDARTTLPCLLARHRGGWDLDSTAAVYGVVAGALHPVSGLDDLMAEVGKDMQCDLRAAVNAVLRQRNLVADRIHGRGKR